MAINKENPKKRFLRKISFEEIDHRLSCGWHVDIATSTLKKKLKSQIMANEYEPEEKISN